MILTNPICRSHLDDHIDNLGAKIATIAAQKKNRTVLRIAEAAIEHTLDKIFGIVWLLEFGNLKWRYL